MSDESKPPNLDPGAIGPLIEELQKLQAQGVTHIHAPSKRGVIELVRGIDESRTRWNDGKNLSATLLVQDSVGAFRFHE